jgi:hypothetical protein
LGKGGKRPGDGNENQEQSCAIILQDRPEFAAVVGFSFHQCRTNGNEDHTQAANEPWRRFSGKETSRLPNVGNTGPADGKYDEKLMP